MVGLAANYPLARSGRDLAASGRVMVLGTIISSDTSATAALWVRRFHSRPRTDRQSASNAASLIKNLMIAYAILLHPTDTVRR
jgi:hypothetical protein